MSTTSTSSCARSTSRWLIWTPLLLVAALLYWTVALGLGGLSLMTVTVLSGGQDPELLRTAAAEDTAPEVQREDQADSIVVRLQESVEPEDVNDNTGSGGSVSVDDPAAVAAPGPGETGY
jgi:hypothetical protein